MSDPANREPVARKIELATGLTYNVLEWGGDDLSRTHTLVLVHGFLDLAWGWAPMVRNLPPHYHVIAPDMRGHGDSDRVGAGGYYYFFDYVADLHSLIDQLGRDTVSVVGHSMGGSISSYYTGSYPKTVHRLALLEGMGPPEQATPVPDRLVAWVTSWKKTRARALREYPDIAAAADRLGKHDPLLDPALALELAEHGTRVTEAGTRVFKHDQMHLTMGPYPFRLEVARSFWQRVTCPVLLVEGAESKMRHHKDEAQSRYASFADARQEVLQGAAHMMQRHQPAALAKLLTTFLADQ